MRPFESEPSGHFPKKDASTMDDRLREILKTLPGKPPRSRLEPYREFIDELRRLGRTYRDIAAILAEKCGLHVSASGVHDFVRVRARREAKVRIGITDGKRASETRVLERTTTKGNSDRDVVQQRIAALKRRSTAVQSASDDFRFDPDEPLRLRHPGGKWQDK